MTLRSTRTFVAFATMIVASLPASLRAQTNSDPSRSPVVTSARDTVKAVAAAAAKTSPAAAGTPAPPASIAAPVPAAPSANASPAAAASPAGTAGSPAAPASPAASGAPPASAPVVAGAKTATTVAVPPGTTIPAGSPVIIVQAAPAAAPSASGLVDSTANNWLGGLIGIGIVAGIAYFGIRAAKSRGLTVEDGLKRLGIETQPAMPAGPAFAAMKPAPAPLPPLPSLSDMPLAGPASPSGLSMAGAATAKRAVALVGVAGPVAGERFHLEEVSQPFSVGRDDINSLALSGDTAISRKHAQIVRQGSDWSVSDLGSSNGTFVNGSRVKGQQPLRAGDEIQIGGSRFRFEG